MLVYTKTLQIEILHKMKLKRWQEMLHDGRRLKKLLKEIRRFEKGCNPIKVGLTYRGKGIKLI